MRCNCGCGERVRPGNRFVNGHNRRKAPFEYEVDTASGCWLWARARWGKYGAAYRRGAYVLAHRAYMEEHSGAPLPRGSVVMHLCDTPLCVNPEHLRVGTQAENIADRDAKNRAARGRRNARSKLDEHRVRRIRELRAEGWSLRAIARDVGVGHAPVLDVLRGRTWSHVADAPKETA